MIESKYLLFQEDCRNGLSLNEALTKHGLSFKEAFKNLKYRTNRGVRHEYNPEDRYLLVRDASVQIRKTLNGKWYLFGSYQDINDARRVRDYLEEHDWSIGADEACLACGVKRNKYNKNKGN